MPAEDFLPPVKETTTVSSHKQEQQQHQRGGKAVAATPPTAPAHHSFVPAATPGGRAAAATPPTAPAAAQTRRKGSRSNTTNRTSSSSFLVFAFIFLHIKPAETGKKKCRKLEERERTKDCRGGNSEEERQQRIKGGKLKRTAALIDQPASLRHRYPFVPRSVLFTSRTVSILCFVFALFK
jgi:hypothetical protein